MIDHAAFPLLELSIVASGAAVLVGLLRIPLRLVVGAQAAYRLWLLVPASALAVLLPAPSSSGGVVRMAVPDTLNQVAAGAVIAMQGANDSMSYASMGLLLWAAGALLMLGLTVRRQYAFVRSLGSLKALPNGTYRSEAVVEPMLVGAWRPRVVLPADFETRYTPEECALVLAHEHAHLQRGDSLINALATGWLCLSWFNPLMYWAVGRLRFDQELACDADVLAATGTARRRYADALMKTQLAADSCERLPIGCHWQSNHPLKARIAALKRPQQSFLRRLVGVIVTLGLILAGSYAVWAAQPQSRFVTAPVAVMGAESKVASETRGLTHGKQASSQERAPILSDGQIHLTMFKAGTPHALLASQVASPHARKTTLHRCPKTGRWVNAL